MRLLPTLLRRLYRAINTDANATLAMRVSHRDGGTIAVSGAMLTAQALTTPQPPPLVLDLAPPLTLRGVADALAGAGWTVEDLSPTHRDRGALALIERAASADDALLVHDSVLWALMDAYAVELEAAAAAVAAAPAMLAAPTAESFWLDELGRYYGPARLPGEPDRAYADRLVAEVLRPKSNNLAMAAIIQATTGQPTVVRDVTTYGTTVPIHDGSITHDGAHVHDADAKAIYGLFDVETAFDLLGGGDINAFRAAIIAQVERLRAAGTLMRQLTVAGGNIADTAAGPAPDRADTAGMGLAVAPAFTEAAAAPADAALTGAAAMGFQEPAAAPADTELPAVAAAVIADTAAAPADASLTAGAAVAGMDEPAPSPDDTAAIPLGAGPILADTAAAPAEVVAAAATLAAMADAAAAPADAALPLSAGPILAEAAAEPVEGFGAAGTASITDAAAAPAEVTNLDQTYTHVLNGAWLLNGTRPLASGAALAGPI